MLKKCIFLSTFFTLFAAHATGSNELSVDQFADLEFYKHALVQDVERVFSDQLDEIDVYKVRYQVEGECAPSENSEACEPVLLCEYVLVDTRYLSDGLFNAEPTGLSCHEDLEEVIGEPILIDEL